MDKWSGQVMYAALVITIGGGLSGMGNLLPMAANYPTPTTFSEQKQQLVVSSKQQVPRAVVKAQAASKSVALRLFSAKTDRQVRAYAMN